TTFTKRRESAARRSRAGLSQCSRIAAARGAVALNGAHLPSEPQLNFTKRRGPSSGDVQRCAVLPLHVPSTDTPLHGSTHFCAADKNVFTSGPITASMPP